MVTFRQKGGWGLLALAGGSSETPGGGVSSLGPQNRHHQAQSTVLRPLGQPHFIGVLFTTYSPLRHKEVILQVRLLVILAFCVGANSTGVSGLP